MRSTTFTFLITIGCLLLGSCSIKSHSVNKRKIKKQFEQSQISNDHFTGFALYDMDEKKMVFELNSDKYFTPASNTKLFTFYTCLKMLGDSIPALRYEVHSDSLVFWGTGDPSFLHSDLKGVKGLKFLQRSDKNIYWSTTGYTGGFFGPGWAWDDYNDDYQQELNAFPIEDNEVLLYADSDGNMQVKPNYFKRFLTRDPDFKPTAFKVQRNFLTNQFVYPQTDIPKKFTQLVPWKTSDIITKALLEDTLKKPVYLTQMPMSSKAKVIYNANADSVYRRMLQPSDNFIAGQLLLVCSSVKFNMLNTDSVIAYSKKYFLNDLPDEPQWADGSGLSRYNLFTPRSIVKLLCKISDEMKNDSLLHSLMPIGGVAGTIKNAYKTDKGKPFVWAKTGSLSNNHNQSGYLITRKGKRLAFSFMNNNFTRPAKDIRNEMVRVITWIHEAY
ncbi:D-alanyl-D-alanine carboxypeptidase/D-alanyl-D-alanine-endopeptidase [Mucilaginibacter sp. FT3.2]|uniref:D-alanyl-D-alanine carboxypeptidase/D-alanyl-D-alanine-endopeptidase n=1 Tax=Mucilaginibacter sp. FT3.2 TaxID=2723090 RepID=UPI00161E5E44|nr:D-alanyl-D-alanine carboxypeptidase [Mucilaginibacter sp. FT3.2]MBB6234675.1 D-alanyl-D-alanine carboxypeptidase/D-alanyl-D-alanine-endopeptidase (penicillin-binding protein 4) [Mucilaginibacter sp. FT3.2]